MPGAFASKDSVFSDDAADILADWLESEMGWEVTKSDNYTYRRLLLGKHGIPPHCQFISERAFVLEIRKFCEDFIGSRLSDRYRLMAHSLLPGDYIGIHDDGTTPGVVFNIYLTRNWSDDQGGYLAFFSSRDLESIEAVIAPLYNRGVAIAALPQALHAVTTVLSGTRTALSYFFWLEPREKLEEFGPPHS